MIALGATPALHFGMLNAISMIPAYTRLRLSPRLATELNLSRIPDGQPPDERQEREILSRTRMWLLCYIIDRFLSIHSGKAWMVQEDEVRFIHNELYHRR